MKKISNDFNPGITHPFYFMRRGLLQAIQTYSSSLSGKLLDFGCGSKPYKSIIHSDQYIGLDFDNPGHSHKNEDVDIIYDGKVIPFPDEYFDSVLCSEVFEHLFDIDFTLGELNRVLSKGGKMLITCPFVWNEHEIPFDYARYTRFSLHHLLEKKGFKIHQYEKKGSFIETIAQVRALYFYSAYGMRLSGIPVIGSIISKSCIALINLGGKIKNSLFKKETDLYLSNILLVEKL